MGSPIVIGSQDKQIQPLSYAKLKLLLEEETGRLKSDQEMIKENVATDVRN